MSAVFLKILNMSITASWLILAVVLVRLLLKKAPKWIPCLLWGLVAIRLICPFSFGSIFSLIPSSETIPTNITVQQEPAINSGITAVNDIINPVIAESFTPVPTDSVNPLQIIIPVAAIVWISGIVIMLAYALFSYIKLKKTVSVCMPVSKRILSCDEVKAPFILGVFKPVIYVPSSMSGETLDLVIRHEIAHLQRHDHWWKPLGYLLLAVYWFNPLCWIAYILLSRDIEMACDEKVIRDMDKDEMAAYSQALLDCSFPRRRIAACPLAFGEVGVKERVKGVLNYKKPAFWIILIAVIACIVLAVCLMTDPFSTKDESVFDKIEESPVAKMELPDGSAFYVDSEISLLRTFADLRLVESPLEPADTEEEWIYRIIYNPAERVKGTDEIIVSFHKDYVQINSEYYLPESGVSYSSILEWARGKYEYFLSNNGDFTIRYELGDTAKDFISTPSRAKTGDTVEIRTQVMFDADIHVYVDGQEIRKTHYDSDYWGYSFIMPDRDVLVTARFYTKGEVWGTETIDLDSLREKYPEYFDLSTFKGLELYVWQMAPDSYSCGLMLGTNRNKTLEELMNLKGASIAEMRAILSTYDIEEKDIIIIPWQNPISSYIAEYWVKLEDEAPSSVEKRQQEYIDGIKQMLFGVDDPGSVTIDIRTDVCALYLDVLEDLWNVDSGLNDGISQIGIDLSELSHLTELEKETVMHEFASKHSLPYIAGTWEELCEQGYIDKDNLYWEDGLFFSIKTNEDAAWSLPIIKEGDSVPELTAFDARKWRSGLGAYFFGQCTAQKNADGKWSYSVGQETIS
jgi:Antirepressor regulating drug resistance, predicted signal transduction N-terminal membrane component